MIGAILGDIIGSPHEFLGVKTKTFKLLDPEDNFITDDTLMTLAIAKAVLEAKKDFKLLSQKAKQYMLEIGNQFPAGYGTKFREWLKSDDPQPYNSYGNGAAMRVSPCGMYYDHEDDVTSCSYAVTSVTHNHPEGLKAAEATALAIFYLKQGMDKKTLKIKMSKYYLLHDTLDEIRSDYQFTEDASETVPQAIQSFLEGKDYIDTIRNAVSLGGDADTLACIAGALAGVYYGIPKKLYMLLDSYVYDDTLLRIINQFEKVVPTKIIE